MKIKLHTITIRDLVKDYEDSHDNGVKGYGGKLDIRPKYQREFVYKDKQRDAVIETVSKDFPLNTMYWAVNTNEEGEQFYEVLDGQQRTISICEYVVGGGVGANGELTGSFSVNYRKWHNLEIEEQKDILDYEIQVYFCEGANQEKHAWFEVINIAGEKLSDQELLNAAYTGPWLTDAKHFFSKRNGSGENIGKDYISGNFIRQEYLETAIKWINDGDVAGYMSDHQKDKNANPLKEHFRKVIDWVKETFVTYEKEMKGIDWGALYSAYGKAKLDPEELDKRVKALRADIDVTSKKGIYQYILDGQEKSLNVRSFDNNMKIEAYERQNGECVKCRKKFSLSAMEADHITPWNKGGKTNALNCQMLCKEDNRSKSDR